MMLKRHLGTRWDIFLTNFKNQRHCSRTLCSLFGQRFDLGLGQGKPRFHKTAPGMQASSSMMLKRHLGTKWDVCVVHSRNQRHHNRTFCPLFGRRFDLGLGQGKPRFHKTAPGMQASSSMMLKIHLATRWDVCGAICRNQRYRRWTFCPFFGRRFDLGLGQGKPRFHKTAPGLQAKSSMMLKRPLGTRWDICVTLSLIRGIIAGRSVPSFDFGLTQVQGWVNLGFTKQHLGCRVRLL